MSNSCYGFAEFKVGTLVSNTYISDLALAAGIGLRFCTVEEMVNFPPDHLSQESSNRVYFTISDSMDRLGAEYLIDFTDYAPEATIGLPLKGSERLGLLTKFHITLMTKIEIEKILITANECGEIDSVKELNSSEIQTTIFNDFEQSAPPNVLYIIRSQWHLCPNQVYRGVMT